jgi:hypothetical protein
VYGLEVKNSEKTRSSGLDDLYITVKFEKFCENILSLNSILDNSGSGDLYKGYPYSNRK